jgi:hypothetical protein
MSYSFSLEAVLLGRGQLASKRSELGWVKEKAFLGGWAPDKAEHSRFSGVCGTLGFA